MTRGAIKARASTVCEGVLTQVPIKASLASSLCLKVIDPAFAKFALRC
jgi:hypothetical protein